MHSFRIPLRTRFRGVTERAGVLIEGPAGWGEFSPFPDYPARSCGRWAQAAWEAARGPWPEPVRDRVPVNVTVPAVDAAEAHRIVSESRCGTAKVKVAEPGQTLEDDLSRCEAVREALGPAGRLRVDANGAWELDEAVRAIRALARFELEYVEQPVPDLEVMARLRRRVDVPLAADESVRAAEDPLRIAGLRAADIVVLKVQPLGGVVPALRVAEAAGLPAVVSSAVETSVGLAAGVALAAALPELHHACGLGTLSLLEGDVVDEPLRAEDGLLAVRRPSVDRTLLAGWRPAPEEAEALIQRYRDARSASPG